MPPNARQLNLQYYKEVRASASLSYFDKIAFTDDPIEQLIWHLGNQKMHNKDNSYTIFWNQVKFFKSFVHEVKEEEQFWWNENMCDSVRVFNVFNQQFLSKLFVDGRIDDTTADKVTIAGWFYLVSSYIKIMHLDVDRNADEMCKEIMDRYFPRPFDLPFIPNSLKFATVLLERGLEQSTEYVKITNKQLADDENATPINWIQYLAGRGDAF